MKDPEKRKKYDTLGENWKAGQEFRPPPGWEQMFRGAPGGGERGTSEGGASGGGGFEFHSGGQFSDFFEAIFGQMAGASGSGAPGSRGGRSASFDDLFGSAAHPRHRTQQTAPMQEAPITITLDEAFHGVTRRLELQGPRRPKER